MAQQFSSEEYGQYSTNNQQGYSGLNIENQSETQPPWNPASGYNIPSGGQTSWNAGQPGTSAPAASLYSAPPVQPMYSNDPQYQQGTNVLSTILTVGTICP